MEPLLQTPATEDTVMSFGYLIFQIAIIAGMFGYAILMMEK
jgi:hypothetical protein